MREGYWLRLNAGGRVQLEKVFRMDGALCILWGWGGSKGFIKVTENRRKLGGWLWYGPINSPRDVQARFLDSSSVKVSG